ncbi:unnamed protein product [Staurois parvus]|uniref:Secreted protein n=1 Tax=Staurois parvus TaxID=386267 RepID=A0ABN9E6L0_9NEOB|nr:unnamed protein product [Staurois parvus]
MWSILPLCLACKVASDYGECCCLPVIGGAVLAMRTRSQGNGIVSRARSVMTVCASPSVDLAHCVRWRVS